MENKIKELNNAMFEVAKQKRAGFDGKLYRFDFDGKKSEPVDESNHEPSDEMIEYYWIEYDKDSEGKPQKKLNLFYKDVDGSSYNVHVIPGLFEEYKLIEEKDLPEAMPRAVGNKDDVWVEIKNATPKKCLSFAEQRSDGKWWCPQSVRMPISEENDEIIEDENNSIKDLKRQLEAIRDFGKKVLEDIAISLESAKKVREIKPYGPTAKRYKPLLCWYNIYEDNSNRYSYSINLTKPIYFQGYGFFTQYHCIDFEKREDGVATKYPVITSDKYDYKAPFSLPKSLNEEDKPTEKELEKIRKALEEFMRNN